METITGIKPPHILETSLACVFAVGDVQAGSIKRVGSAVGEGSIVISLYIERCKTNITILCHIDLYPIETATVFDGSLPSTLI